MGAVVIASVALAITGCSSNTEAPQGTSSVPSTAVSVAKVDDIANLVPENIRSTGKLVIGVNVPYTPNEFKDPSGKLVGFDVDLMNAITGVLGLTPDYRESDFEKIIPSIQGGTYNVGMSSFTDNKEREAQVDFVTYFSAGTLWAQRPGAPIDPNDACGKKVAVQSTTTQDDEVTEKSAKCTAAGKPAIEVLKFDGQDLATNAVIVGQADAVSADSPVVAYAIKQSNGKLEAAGEIFASAPYGWPIAKGSPLGQALLKALEHLIQNGQYKTIATNWSVEAGVITKPVINGAIN